MSPDDILPHKSACGPVIFISGNASTMHHDQIAGEKETNVGVWENSKRPQD